jgi:peptide/nickel transport system ATP-binding protein
MGSIPAIGHAIGVLKQIDGAMPRLGALPSGCAFHPRCRRRIERCQAERPDLRSAGATAAACWLAGAGADV